MTASRLFPIFAALLAAIPAAAAPTLTNAQAYVLGVYRRIPDPKFDYRTVRYSSELGSLLRRDEACASTGSGICALDGIPFCDCQDTDPNYQIVRSSVKRRGRDGAAVSLLLRNGSESRFNVDLARADGTWRVADIHSPMVPSLLAWLRREVPREEKSLIRHGRK